MTTDNQNRRLKLLTRSQLEEYERDGVLFPLEVLGNEKVSGNLAHLDRLESLMGGRISPKEIVQPQLYFRWIWDLALEPRILDAVEDVIGPDILVHSLSLFCKYPGDSAFVSWHQDGHYWRMNQPTMVSAWVALTRSCAVNGCMRVIPGTHGSRRPHHERKDEHNILGSGLTIDGDNDESEAVNVELEPGEMSLHHMNAVHGSSPNRGTDRRIGVAIRYVHPAVRQEFPHHEVLLARGQDDFGNYRIRREVPPADWGESMRLLKEERANVRRIREAATKSTPVQRMSGAKIASETPRKTGEQS